MRQCRLVWRMEKVRIGRSKFLPKYFPNTIQNICPNLKIAKKSLHLLITKVVTKTENHFSWQSQTSLFHHCCSSRSHHQPYLLLLLLHPLLLSSRFPLHHRLSLRHHPLPSDGFKRGNERWFRPRHQKLNQWQPIIIRIRVPFHKYFENAVRRILLFELFKEFGKVTVHTSILYKIWDRACLSEMCGYSCEIIWPQKILSIEWGFVAPTFHQLQSTHLPVFIVFIYKSPWNVLIDFDIFTHPCLPHPPHLNFLRHRCLYPSLAWHMCRHTWRNQGRWYYDVKNIEFLTLAKSFQRNQRPL